MGTLYLCTFVLSNQVSNEHSSFLVSFLFVLFSSFVVFVNNVVLLRLVSNKHEGIHYILD